MQKLLTTPSNSKTVVNFWASWCKPCVEELPCFANLANEGNGKVRIILVSLDATSRLSTAQEILKKKGIDFQTYLLTDPNPNAWIDKINPKWGGSIPASAIYDSSGKQVAFVEKSFEKCDELYEWIYSTP
ncbi:MAG: TlpA family protein disulfide reductase [Bacteroidia bacterium]|nr:TlpA family protein disulfide reductase [Bacteroidia bacterium]